MAPPKKITVQIEAAELPVYKHEGSAGMELKAHIGMARPVMNGTNEFISTGITIDVPRGLVAKVYAHPELTNKGLFLADGVVVIDSTDEGPLMLMVANRSVSMKTVENGSILGTLMFEKVERIKWDHVKTPAA